MPFYRIFHSPFAQFPLLLLLLTLSFISCNLPRKVIINKSMCLLDFKNAKTLATNLKKNEFNFTWLKAKLSVEAEIDSSNSSFSISLRIKKDSIIWMSISKLGIEGARVLISKDSVQFFTTIMGNKFFKGDFAYINKLLCADLDFEMLQSLLVGNSVEFYDELERVKSGADNCQYTLGTIRKRKLHKIIEKGKEFKEPVQSIYLVPETFKISRILFYDFNPNRSFDARFENFEKQDSTQLFPMKIRYTIRAQKHITVHLNYSKIVLNEEQTFPFKIPDHYEPIVFKEQK